MHIAVWLLQLQKALTLWKQVYFQFYWMSTNIVKATNNQEMFDMEFCSKLSIEGGFINFILFLQFFCNMLHLQIFKQNEPLRLG